MKVAVIGGGAAGFFAAINCKHNHPQAKVILFEKSQKVLSKVKISGGGRCNVTTSITDIKALSECYPRGKQYLKKAFHQFNSKHAFEWFELNGVPLKIEADGRVFPISDDSQSIIDCLMHQIKKHNIEIRLGASIQGIQKEPHALKISLKKHADPIYFDKVIVATGGSPKLQGFDWLKKLDHQIEPPVPSLFTFNMPKESITALMGISLPNALISIQGSKLKSNGPILITHWGLSGPAVLRLSAFGARLLSDKNYTFAITINWINEKSIETVKQQLEQLFQSNSKKILNSVKAFGIPSRFWIYILERAKLNPQSKCGELGKKSINKLVSLFTADVYQVEGKTTFKEEFVTCGGISLKDININTMESKKCPNLYFCGEVLDIDGITGGFNFQAAWTTGFIAGKLINSDQ